MSLFKRSMLFVSIMAQTLESRLRSLNTTRWSNEWYYIIRDFILVPMIPQLVEERGCFHKVVTQNSERTVYRLDLYFEREKRRGFRNWLARLFAPYVLAISFKYDNSVYVCTYYDYRYFGYAEDIKKAYYEKLKQKYFYDLVVVGKA